MAHCEQNEMSGKVSMTFALISRGNINHAVPYLRHMVAAGVDVHWLQIAPGIDELPHVTIHRCYGKASYRSNFSKLSYFGAGRLARKVLEDISADVVNAHYASSGGVVAWLSGFRPYAVTIHGSDLIERSRSVLGRFFLKRVFRQAALVNPVCEHMVPTLNRLGVPDDRIFVMPFGIDLPVFDYQPREKRFSEGLRLICTRALRSAVYDIPTLLRALAEVRRRGVDASLTLAATGKLQKDFEALADKLGISESVVCLGGYAQQDLPAIFARHDVYVSASLWDGASLSLMEAMACGIFPVVSDISANREWLTDGMDGLLFRVGDYIQLADILQGISSRKDMVVKAVAKGRKTVEARADRVKNLSLFTERLMALPGNE